MMKKILIIALAVWAYYALFDNDNSKLLPHPDFNAAQQDYYVATFDYVMDNVEAQKPYHWDSGTRKGFIAAGEKYTSKLKAICRDFSETIIVPVSGGGETTETMKAVACKRESGKGWCRLKESDAHTCAFETTRSGSGKILGGSDDILNKGSDILRHGMDLLR